MNNKYLWFLLMTIITIISLISNTKQFDLNDNNIFADISSPEFKSDISIVLHPLMKILNDTLYEIISSMKNNENISKSDICFNSFHKSFFSSNYSISESYLQKFVEYTSINTNDISYYRDCMGRKSNTSYVIIKFYRKKDEKHSSTMNYYYPDNCLRGFCLPSGCSNDEYIYIINELIHKRKEIMPIKFEIDEYPKKIFVISREEDIPNNFQLYFSIFLLSFIIIQTLFVLFPITAFYISYFFLKCCCCCLKTNINKIGLKRKFIGFRKCFSMSRNYHKLNEENIKDEGLTFFKGIRGINMFFYLLGMVFIIILHSPSKMDCYIMIRQVYENPLYFIIFYSIKYSSIFLLSCSGAVLGYKFLNFLDEKIKITNLEENNLDKTISLDNSGLLAKDKKEEEDFRLINIGMLFRFILYQLNKYFTFILILLFTKYSFHFLGGSKPTWRYFKEFLTTDISFLDIIKNSLLFCLNIFHSDNDEYDPVSTIIFDYNWLAFNEIFLFLIGIFIIYFCAKKQYQIIHIIVFFNVISLLFKLGTYIFEINKYVLNKNYAPYILTYSYFGKIAINPIANIGIYLTGIYYGILLYAYQKEITGKKAHSQGKIFMNGICLNLIRTLKSTKKNSSFIISILLLFVVFIFSVGQLFLRFLDEKDDETKTNFLKFIHYLFLFDNEIIVFCTFKSIFYLTMAMNIELFSFLRSSIWRFLNKIYFSYITVSIPLIIFFVYHSNSKILFNFTNIIYYSIVIIVFTFIIGLLNYLIFERPLRNIIRAKYIRKDKKNLMNRINDIDRTTSKSLIRE